ncbi:MAG: GTP-binding protein [Promethearchaeota archaeon]
MERDYLILYINSINDSFERLRRDLIQFKSSVLGLIEDPNFNINDQQDKDKIDHLVYSTQNRFPPIISFVGYHGVGKTTIISLLRSKEISIEKVTEISGEVATLKIGRLYFLLRDFTGDEKVGFLWNNFIRGSDAVFLVTDSTQKCFEDSKIFLRTIEEEVPYAYTAGIGNKQDLVDALNVEKAREFLGFKFYPMIALESQYRENLILFLSEILEMKEYIAPVIDLLFERERMINYLEENLKNERFEGLDSLFDKIINLSTELGDDVEPFYRLQLKLKEGITKGEQPSLKPEISESKTPTASLSILESSLKVLLKNFMKEVLGVMAVTICDREGLIITSERKEDVGDESVIGAIAASVDSYIDRIKKEFQEETSFFNITTIGDKKFAYCSMGLQSILLAISDLTSSDTELRVYSEHIAGKVEMLLEGNENVSLKIPQILKILSKTKDGKIPECDFSLKLILTGDYEVVKTSLILRFVQNMFKESYHSTVGVEISKKTINLTENTEINFAIWDIGGQITQMTPFRKRFYEGANAAFIVIDRTKPESLNSIQKWYNEISKYIGKETNIIIVGNKSDLIDKIVISEEDIKKVANQFNFYYILTSAKTGENVNDAFLYIAYRFLELASQ